MRRSIRLLPLLLGLFAALPAMAGEVFTETFDSTANADLVATTALWDTTAGQVTLVPRPMTLLASYGLPGGSVDVVIRGDMAYVAAGGAGMLAVDITTAASPALIGLFASWPAVGVDVEGDLAALAGGSSGMALVDVTNDTAPSFLWGKGAEYVGDVELVANRAYVSLNDSLRILDVSDPTSPLWLGSVPLAGGGGYRFVVQGAYAYCARGSNLSIVDVSDPTNPVLVATDVAGSSFYDVRVDGDHAYATIVDQGVRSYDVSDPANPLTLSTLSPGGYAYGLSLSGDWLTVTMGSAGVIELDVTDPASPVPVASLDTPGTAGGAAVTGGLTVVADGASLVVLSNADLASSIGTFASTQGTASRLVVQGQYAYVAEGVNGLSIVSIERADAPFAVSNLALTNAKDVAVSGDIAYVADGAGGLRVVDISSAANPSIITTVPTDGTFMSYDRVVANGHIVYALVAGPALRILFALDMSDPASPVPLNALPFPIATDLDVEGGVAVLASGYSLYVINVSDPSSPGVLSTKSTSSMIDVVTLAGNRVYAAGGGTLQVLDISNPASPTIPGTTTFSGASNDIAIEGNIVYVACGTPAIRGFLVSDPAAPSEFLYVGGVSATGIAVSGEYFYSAAGASGVLIHKGMNRRFASTTAWAQSTSINPRADAVVGVRPTPQFTRGITLNVTVNGSTFALADSGQWTFFSSPDSDVKWKAYLNGNYVGLTPALSELTLDLLYEYPEITAIADVGNDQGRQVRLAWDRSGLDHAGSPTPILEYAIYRKQVPGLAPLAAVQVAGAGTEAAHAVIARNAAARFADPVAVQLAGWDFVTSVPAETEDTYSVLVPTLADSTDGTGVVYSTFLVRARTATPGEHFDSPADSGYSVDNLAPSVPANAMASYGTGSGNQLSWDPPVDPDFRYFRVYRDTDPDFMPGPVTLIDVTTESTWTDSEFDGGTVFYKLTAVDFSGNESAAAAPAGPTVGVPPRTSVALSLSPASPSPFSGATSLRFTIPRDAGRVRLEIFDLHGRRVRTLVDGPLEPGAQSVTWRGRDTGGRRLPGGLYLIRLSAARRALTGKVVLLGP